MAPGPWKDLLDDLAANLAAWIAPHLPPRRPLLIRSVRFIRETLAMPNVLYFEPQLPPPGDTDVVERILTVATSDGGSRAVDVSAGPAEFGVIEGLEVTLTLRETDAAGRKGPPSEPFTFTAEDVFPPSRPDALGVRFLREEAVEDEPAAGATP